MQNDDTPPPLDHMAVAFRQAARLGLERFTLVKDGTAWTGQRHIPGSADVGRTSYNMETAIVGVLCAGISPKLFAPDPWNDLHAAAQNLLRVLNKEFPG